METKEDLAKKRAKEALLQSNLWEELTSTADQIILFGSWSVSMECADSDIDLLCIGTGKRLKRKHLDFVWVSPTDLCNQGWLGSELASHVAHYGIWLHGSDTWSKRVFISAKAIAFKEKLIRYRMKALRRLWRKLRAAYCIKHVVKLRRDVQRLYLMRAGHPVEPSPLLDLRWAASGATQASLVQLLAQTKTSDLISSEDLDLIKVNLRYLDWRTETKVVEDAVRS